MLPSSKGKVHGRPPVCSRLVLETMMRKSQTRMRTTLRTSLKRLQKMSEEDEQEIDAVERLRSELGEKFEMIQGRKFKRGKRERIQE